MKSGRIRIPLMIYVLVVGAVSLLLLFMNLGLYRSPELLHPSNGGVIDQDLLSGLRYLEGRGMEGVAREMQNEYPEGFVFAWAFYGLAWSRIAADAGSDTTLHNHAMGQARAAYRRIDSDEGRSVFSPGLSPPYGVFYNGWRNLLLGSVIAARRGSNRVEDSLFSVRCDLIVRGLRQASTPFPSSYPGQAWPADGVVAVASLAYHDRLFAPRYTEDLWRWRADVERRFDPTTGLIPHSVDPIDGSTRQGARGSSQGLMLSLLPIIDSGLAAKQYVLYRRHFFTTWLGLPAVREHPHGIEGEGDIDSGPVLFGVGAAASVVGVGAMRANGEPERAEEQRQTIDGLGFPWESGGERRYFFGLLPMGDLFLAWGRSLPAGKSLKEMTDRKNKPLFGSPTMLKLPFTLLSAFVVFALLIPVPLLCRRSRHKGQENEKLKKPLPQTEERSQP